MSTDKIVSKVWRFCNTLRDDGVGYGDYLEQLTYLLFLKMADEFSKQPYNRNIYSTRIQTAKLNKPEWCGVGGALLYPAP